MPVPFNIHYVQVCLCTVFLCCLLQCTDSSPGDRSDVYRQCLYFCRIKNCSNTTGLAHFKNVQPWYMSALSWECSDECQYTCMWYTVRMLQSRGYAVPQFHGKWPFVRIWGIQEPASVLFSVLNAISHLYMWQKFRKSVPSARLFGIWNIQAMLSLNAWIWSAVFHTRDTPLTEKLDYFCAFSLVLYSFYCLLIKAFSQDAVWYPLVLAVPFSLFFTYHIYYLTFVKFDYGYNLRANIFVGLMNSVGWMLWCYKNKRKPYVWKCAISVLIVNMLLLLELGDFPPWGYFVDAHALWHLGTIPVPLLWYSFLIEDCLYSEHMKKKI